VRHFMWGGEQRAGARRRWHAKGGRVQGIKAPSGISNLRPRTRGGQRAVLLSRECISTLVKSEQSCLSHARETDLLCPWVHWADDVRCTGAAAPALREGVGEAGGMSEQAHERASTHCDWIYLGSRLEAHQQPPHLK